jgi:hypothetical protein
MRIALAADHAGYQLKDELSGWLREAGHEVTDLGTNGPQSVDYPQYGAQLAEELQAAALSAGSPYAAPASASPSPSTATRRAAARGSTSRFRRGWRASIMMPMCWRSARG